MLSRPSAVLLCGGSSPPFGEQPGLIGPDMDRNAFVMGAIDRGEGGAPVDGSEPAGIAMRQNIDPCTRALAPPSLGDQLRTVLGPLFSLFSAATYERVARLPIPKYGLPSRSGDPTAPTHRQTTEPDLPKSGSPPVRPVLLGGYQAPILRRPPKDTRAGPM